MALQALAAYYKTDAKVKEEADKAVTCLSKLQNTTGGYDSYGSVNSESAAQVITALTASASIRITTPALSKTARACWILCAASMSTAAASATSLTASSTRPRRLRAIMLAAYYRFAWQPDRAV